MNKGEATVDFFGGSSNWIWILIIVLFLLFFFKNWGLDKLEN